MKRIFTALSLVILAGLSHGAQAEWVLVDQTTRDSTFIGNPVSRQDSYAYPAIAIKYRRAVDIGGWKYRMRSLLAIATVDCSNGSVLVGLLDAASGRNLNGHHIRLAWIRLKDGRKLRVGKVYGYAWLPASVQGMINFACS